MNAILLSIIIFAYTPQQYQLLSPLSHQIIIYYNYPHVNAILSITILSQPPYYYLLQSSPSRHIFY